MMASAVRRGTSAGWNTCPANRLIRVGCRSRCRRSRSCLYAQLQPQLRSATSDDSASSSANTTSAQAPGPRGSPPAQGGSGGGDPEEKEPTSGSLQIGFDAFTQQLLLAAVTGGAAAAIAFLGHVDLSSALRLELDALSLAAELCAPVLVLLLVVCAPRWAPPFQGSELARLQHNHYLTAQVLQLYDVLDDDDEEEEEDEQQQQQKKMQGQGQQSSASAGAGAGTGSSRGDGGANGRAGSSGPGGTGERARVRRRLRLEQTLGWGTVSSALALVQAYMLQPWNPPTPNALLGAALAGRGMWQLANEALWRGAVWGLLAGGVGQRLARVDASDGLLFLGRVFGGEDAATYIAGLGLVALSLPGALWEARNLRNFVRASVVGPVRDAAIFCTGDGVNQPAYCDPRGYALLAARRPANAASVADVVTRTRAWVQGPDQSYGSMDSMDVVEGGDRDRSATTTSAAAGAAATATATASGDGKSNRNSTSSPAPSPPPPPSAASSAAAGLGRAVGARVQASSAAFEADSRDMGVLLSVETMQVGPPRGR